MSGPTVMNSGDNGDGHGPIDGRCNARRRDKSGGLCRRGAGQGTEHVGHGPCDLHGGNTASHVVKAQRDLAAQAAATYGAPREVHPVTALFEEVHRTAGHVAWLAQVIADLERDDLVWGRAEETVKGAGEFPGRDTVHKAAPNVWLELYLRERRHLVDVCKTVVSLSLEERRDRLAEQQGARLALVIESILDDRDLALTAAQRARAVALVVARIGAMAGRPVVEGRVVQPT